MSRLLRGSKVSSRHQSYTPDAARIIEYGQKADVVKKVILGPIINTTGKNNKRIKLRPNQTSVQVDVISNQQVQIIYLVGDTYAIVKDLEDFKL